MQNLIATVSAVIIGVSIAVAVLLKKSLKNASGFFSKKPLSEPEQILYWQLIKALPNHVVLAQVSFSRFLYTKNGTGNENFSRLATARQKVADFVICDKSFYILAVIELDDSTHSKEKDDARDAILQEAGLKTIRWKNTKLPTTEEIQKIVNLK
jgi:hypothetical protein